MIFIDNQWESKTVLREAKILFENICCQFRDKRAYLYTQNGNQSDHFASELPKYIMPK